MAATPNTQFNHVDRLNAQLHSDGDGGDGAPPPIDASAIEGMYVLNELIHEEAELRYQSDLLEARAQELERDGDDVSRGLADQMRQQAGLMLSTALKIGQAIHDIRSDPHRKISRHVVEHLHASCVMLKASGEHEIEAAHAAHSDTVEHKSVIHHQLRERAHSHPSTKPEKRPLIALSLPKLQVPALVALPEHAPSPWVVHTREQVHACWKQATHKAQTVWVAAAHKAEEVAESMTEKVHAGIHKVKQVGHKAWHAVTHCTPVVVAGKVAAGVYHGITHPKALVHGVTVRVASFAHGVVGRARQVAHHAKETVLGWFGQVDPVVEQALPSRRPRSEKQDIAYHKALEMVRRVGWLGITGGVAALPGALTPSLSPMLSGMLPGFSVIS